MHVIANPVRGEAIPFTGWRLLTCTHLHLHAGASVAPFGARNDVQLALFKQSLRVLEAVRLVTEAYVQAQYSPRPPQPEQVRAARRAGQLSKRDEAFLADLPKNPEPNV